METLGLVGAAVLILIAAIMFILDMIGRAEMVQQKWPRVWKWVTSRPLIVLMLLVSLALLDRDYKDATAIAPSPIVKIVLPPPPRPPAQIVIEHQPAREHEPIHNQAEPYSEAKVTFSEQKLSDANHILVKLWIDRPIHQPIYFVQFNRPVTGGFGGSSYGYASGGIPQGLKLPPNTFAYGVKFPDPVTSDTYVVFTANADSEVHVVRAGLVNINH